MNKNTVKAMFGQMYHGTDKGLDHVRPNEGVWGKAAYATNNKAEAVSYAYKKTRKKYTQDFPEQQQDKPVQRELFGTVYKVSPISEGQFMAGDPERGFMQKKNRDSVYTWDHKGMRVDGVETYVHPEGGDLGSISVRGRR